MRSKKTISLKLRQGRVLGLTILGALQVLALVAQQTPEPESSPESVSEPGIVVDVAWVLGHGEDLVLVDTRSAVAHREGRLRGSVRLAGVTATTAPGETRTLLATAGVERSKTVVLYGDDRVAIASVFFALERAGREQVHVLTGGLETWIEAEGAVVTGEPTPWPAVVDSSSVGDSVAAITLRETQASLGQAGFEILDLRDGVDWTTQDYEAPARFRAGHIPAALPFEVESWLPADGGWPAVDLVRQRLKAVGPRPGTRVRLGSTFVLYGDEEPGRQVLLAYLLLRHAGIETRVLVDGWHGWLAEENPVVQIVTTEEVAAMLETENPGLADDRRPEGMILLDNRGAGAFDASHLPGATALPAELFLDEFESVVEEGWPGVDRTQVPVVFYCYGRSCVRSRYCSTRAAEMGFRKLMWFREGVPGWQRAGLRFYP